MGGDPGKYKRSYKNAPTEQENIEIRCFIEVPFLKITKKINIKCFTMYNWELNYTSMLDKVQQGKNPRITESSRLKETFKII